MPFDCGLCSSQHQNQWHLPSQSVSKRSLWKVHSREETLVLGGTVGFSPVVLGWGSLKRCSFAYVAHKPLEVCEKKVFFVFFWGGNQPESRHDIYLRPCVFPPHTHHSSLCNICAILRFCCCLCFPCILHFKGIHECHDACGEARGQLWGTGPLFLLYGS